MDKPINEKLVNQSRSARAVRKVQSEADFIRSPMEWPRWPELPLVSLTAKFHDEGFLGILLDQQAPPYIVYSGKNVFKLPEVAAQIKRETGKQSTWQELLKDAKQHSYDTVEALLKEWRVD